MIVKIKPSNKSASWEGGFKSPRFKGAKDSLTAFYTNKGNRITGLTPEDEERLGKVFKQDLNPVSPFWDDYRVILTSKELTLDTSRPEDELKYLLLKAHYRVKTSISDLSKPNADYVIVDEMIEATTTMSKAEEKLKAYTSFSTLTLDQKSDILRLYKGYINTGNMDPAIINSKLYTEMEKDFNKFNSFVGDNNRDLKIFLTDLVSAGIITKNRNAYKYGDDIIGHNEEAAIDYIKDPSNQSLKVALMRELKDFNKRK